MAVGFSLPVSEPDARAVFLAFYQALFTGRSADAAYQFAKSTLEDSKRSNVEIRLYTQKGVQADKEILCPAIEFIARFPKNKVRRSSQGEIEVEFGLDNCPTSTYQTTFFTNSRYWVDDETSVDAGEMCEVVVDEAWTTPGNKRVWCENAWPMPGNLNMFACVLTGEGGNFLVQSSICDALQRYYQKANKEEFLQEQRWDIEVGIEKLKEPS